MKLGELIKRIIAMVAGVLVYVSMAFTFISLRLEAPVVGSTTTGCGFNDWLDLVNNASEYTDWGGWWSFAKIMYIISFVVAGLLILSIVVQFFVKNNALDLAVKILGIALIVLAVLGFGSYLIGQFSSATNTEVGYSSTYLPSAGIIVMTIAGISAGIVSLMFKSQSEKKSKRKKK